MLEAHDEYWGGRPPVKRIRFVEVPEVPSRINGLLSGQYQFACDIPPDQISDIEKQRRVRGAGRHDPQSPPDRASTRTTRSCRTRWCAAPSPMRSTARRSSTRCGPGRTRVPAGLQWEYYGDMFHADWTVPEYNPKLAQDLLKQAGYKGDPIPYRLLNNYYTNQNATAQVLVEMWKQVGLNVEIQTKENWTQIMERGASARCRDWSNSAPFNDPVSSIVNQHGPNGQQQQIGEWTNAEMNKLCEVLETSTDRAARKTAFRRMLEICEREDPAYTVLHQNATFTAKPKAIKLEGVTGLRDGLPAGQLQCVTPTGSSGRARQSDRRLRRRQGPARHRPRRRPGEALGLVGEFGLRQVGDLARSARPAAGEGHGVAAAPALAGPGTDRRRAGGTLDKVRGGRIAMIFQDPASSLNPVRRPSAGRSARRWPCIAACRARASAPRRGGCSISSASPMPAAG